MSAVEAHELTIERLAAGGDGVAHLADGRVAFVALTAPGDRVRARIVEEHPRFVRAEIVALLVPGPRRIPPRCPVFGACGGCRWQHLDEVAQREARRAIVEEALQRVGGITLKGPIEIVPSPSAYGYRGRTRVVVHRGRVGYRHARSHEVCAVQACPVLVPALERALAELAAHPPPDGEWELVADAAGAVRRARVEAGPRARAVRGPQGSATPGPHARVAGREHDDALQVSPLVFVQSNVLLVDALVDAVAGAAGTGERALELFAGAGLFTRPLARRFARVVAVEAQARAAADLARNLRDARIENVRVVEARAEAWLAQAASEPIDVVVLDPPRRGLAPGAAAALAALRAHRIVHVSCDPATLARDLRVLAGAGWRLVSVRAFDLFPQTPHVETLAVLERTTAQGAAEAIQGVTRPCRSA